MVEAGIVLASNRGPVSYQWGDDGELRAKRGAGGLVSSVGPVLEGTGATWVAAAMNDAEREAASRGPIESHGFRLRLLDVGESTYAQAYDAVSNSVLWFAHHGLYDLPRRPRFDRRFRQAWDAYRSYNQAFADAVADDAPEGGTVLVQDYHLSLVGAMLRKARPDVRSVHFSHTPFATPALARVLPDEVRGELLAGLAANTACGFHARRWADHFTACCAAEDVEPPHTFVSPIAPDPADITSVAGSDACAAEAAWVDERVGGCKLVLRVDRIELSKNIVRGFLAFDDLLEQRPEWRGQVVFLALVYPSRQALAEYQAYRAEVAAAAARVNSRWATGDWTPIVLDEDDNFPRSVAALKRYDVLLINPVRDGLNLVAKEGPLVNENDGVLALSREAGGWDELAEGALGLNPFDLVETSDVLHAALSLPADERAAKAATLRRLVQDRTPRDWLDDQLAAAGAGSP